MPGQYDAGVPGAAAAVQAMGLVLSFGRVRALNGFDLEVEEGEVFGLVGPNGAGKTSFIRVLAGLLRPDAGTARVLGRLPGRQVAAEVGYMTQSPALYEDLPLLDNLTFFARLFGLSRRQAHRRSVEIASLMGLEAKLGARVRELSGGMRQLANLACALVHGPRLLLLDEPTVGIDPGLRRRLWEHFRKLNREGATILLTTHVMEEAERCDRVAMVAAGKVVALGGPEELRRTAGAASLEEAYTVFTRAGEERAG